MKDTVAWEKYVNKYIGRDIQLTARDYVAVLIEPRNHPLLPGVLSNFMYLLQDNWELCIVYSPINNDVVYNTTKDWGKVTYIRLDSNNLSRHQYNKLLLTVSFYKLIPCENILIFQTDALLRKAIPTTISQYDYVGAPWPWITTCYCSDKPISVGNGGLSFRKKSLIIKELTNNPDHLQYNDVNEDVIISCLMSKYNVPTIDIANTYFSEGIHSANPYGLHNPYYTDTQLLL